MINELNIEHIKSQVLQLLECEGQALTTHDIASKINAPHSLINCSLAYLVSAGQIYIQDHNNQNYVIRSESLAV